MPTGSYDFNATTKFEVTYPTYMSNCSVCHDSPTTLTAANAMPVTGPGCFSCHESMDSWDFAESGATFHEAYTATDELPGMPQGQWRRGVPRQRHAVP